MLAWDDRERATLVALLQEATRRLAAWGAAGLGVHTFRGVSYPAQLREIHQVLWRWTPEGGRSRCSAPGSTGCTRP